MSEKVAKGSKQVKVPYRDTLDTKDRARYEEKMKIVDGNDPYELGSYSSDVNLLPSVTYPDIVNYLLFTPSVFTLDDLKCYKATEAHKQFLAGWVFGVSTVVIDGKRVVRAKVMHSMKLAMKPLNPWIILEKDGKVLASHCDCTAGLGEACTHVASLLYAIDGTVRVRDSRTVTQEPAYWLLPSAVKKVSYAEVRDIDFSSAKSMKRQFDSQCDNLTTTPGWPIPTSAKKVKKPVPTPTQSDLQLFYENLHATGKKSALLSVIPGFADNYIPKTLCKRFPPDLSDLRDNGTISLNFKELLEKCSEVKLQTCAEEIENLESATKEQAKSKLWYQFRAGRITASKMKSVTRTDPSNPAQSLIKSVCYPVENKFETEATKWGIQHEKDAIGSLIPKLEEQGHENITIQDCGLFVSEDYPFIAATPDCMVSCDCCGVQLVEVKCPYSRRDQLIKQAEEKFYLKTNNEGELCLDQDHEYFYQVQTQMGVTKIESCLFVVWTTLDIHVEQIAFNHVIWQEMCSKAEHFFQTAVLPELVGKFYSRLPGSGLPTYEPNQKQPLSAIGDNTASSSKEELWCYCNQVEFGDMIYCDNENCDIKWFHYECLSLKSQPKCKYWYCPDCRKLPEFSRKRVKKTDIA